MMRGPSYDDAYISRKMSHLHGPTFSAPGPVSYGRPPLGGYLQEPYSYDYVPRDSYTSPYSSYSATTTYSPDSTEVREERRSVSPAPSAFRPSAATQLILNRVALRAPRSSVSPLVRGYAPLGPPPPRMVPRMPPAYYDYDYGYGGYYGYAPPPPRISRYDSYLDDDLPEPAYVPRYRPRLPDPLDDTDFRDRSHHPHMLTTTTTTTTPRTTAHTRGYSPGMLQDHVDKMRIRLKSLAYSLDPTGPVPEIILPDRHKKSGALDDKKYSSGPKHLACVEFAGGQPQWKRKARARYPPDDPENVAKLCKEEIKDAEEAPEKEKEKLILKDRLSNRIHEFFNSTMTADQFDKYLKTYRQPGPKLPHAQVRGVMPDSSSRYTKLTSKWEEPDTVFGAPTDKKPYSKAITDGATEEGSEERKERRKKKKSKERELAPETSAAEAPADLSEVEPVSAPTESEPPAAAANGEPGADDDKERKKLEKKKRKAEREAAAKAAMEAELAALAAAEAELARLEAESSSLKPDAPAPEVSAPVEVAPAPAEPAAEVKSESAAEKCESSREVVCEVVCVTPETLGELAPSTSPLQLPPQEEQVPQLTEEPQAIQEPQQAEEPPVEPQLEPTEQKPQVEEPQVEAPVEPPVEEPPLEETKAEEVQMKPPAEVPQPKIAQVDEPQVEEPQVEPPVEEPQVVEPQTEPPVEAQTEAAYVEESMAVVEEPPCRVVRRAAGGDDDAGWLDAWAGEEAAAGAAEETGAQHLGTEVSDDLATTTIRAEAGQEEPDAAADAAAAADTLTTGVAPTRLGDEPLQ